MGTYPILEKEIPIIFFDTTCLLCNKTVQFLLRVDTKNKFMFASLTSSLGQHLTKEYFIEEDSVVFYLERKCYDKSRAFFMISRILGFPYNLLTIFYILPTKLTDWTYDVIARNRFRWFGKTDHCIIPTKKYADRIILE